MITIGASSSSCQVCDAPRFGVGVVELKVRGAHGNSVVVSMCERHAREAATELLAAVNEAVLRRVLADK